ncbi:MAG: hypothetical protein U0869_06630 [Chloroflexota bacterium]
MTHGLRSRSTLIALAWAIVGVLGGHVATYAILFPDQHVHDQVLAESGHAWMELLWPAVLTGTLVAVALGLLGGAGRGGSRGIRFTTLALLQVAIFGGLEIAERVASSGLTVESLPHQLIAHGLAAILLLGSLIQVVTAWLGSALSRVVAAVAERLRPAPPRRRLAHRHLLPAVVRLPAARPVRAHGSRGPPLRGLVPLIP